MKSILVSVAIGLFWFVITAGPFLVLSLVKYFSGVHTLKLDAITGVSAAITALGALVAWKSRRVAESIGNWMGWLPVFPWW